MSEPLTLYRIITAPDDPSFCHKVTEALAKGWVLYGSPSMVYDATRGLVICGQGVTKNVEGVSYSPYMKLGSY